MTDIDPEARRRRERARQEGIWRYLTIQEAASPALSGRQRGAVVRRIVAETTTDGFGNPRRVSRPTAERWLRAYRTGGLAALTPAPRQVTPRTDPQILEQAAALKAQVPARTAEQVRRILITTAGWSPSAKTLQRHFRRLQLAGPHDAPAAFGTFEAARPNDLWTGDALHGPVIEGRKCYLFCFIDDHSRAVMAGCWGRSEGIVALSRALRPALASRAVPVRIFVDNGSAFCDAALVRACACLGIKITHSTPCRPPLTGQYLHGPGSSENPACLAM
jgi:putative transposase